jgi:cystathionine gamma-synthase
MQFDTIAARAGIGRDGTYGAVVPPLHLSTTFAFPEFASPGPYDYTRTANPTRDLLAESLAALEQGVGAVPTGTGMSAVALALHLARPGDLVVAPHDCYGGTWRLLAAKGRREELRVEFRDLTTHEGLRSALALKPKLLWLETPSNPLLRITDIRAAVALAQSGGALVAVDNTFLSPALQQPLPLGADLVVHSTTKYLNGHSDVVGGAVISRDPAVHEELKWWANCLGIGAAPFDSWLVLRGIRTLQARIRRHLENSDAILELLVGHPAVSAVHYPWLPDHPGHAVARGQQRGGGAIVSFELAGGVEAVRAATGALRLFTLAESLGGVESLVAHPATMTHASMTPEARAAAGITDGLLRLSVGIEDPEDLVADLQTALEAATVRSGRAGEAIHAGA